MVYCSGSFLAAHKCWLFKLTVLNCIQDQRCKPKYVLLKVKPVTVNWAVVRISRVRIQQGSSCLCAPAVRPPRKSQGRIIRVSPAVYLCSFQKVGEESVLVKGRLLGCAMMESVPGNSK